MTSETTNYKLVKPDPEEFYDVGVQNSNLDKIDTALKELEDSKASNVNLISLEQTVNEQLAEKATKSDLIKKADLIYVDVNLDKKRDKSVLIGPNDISPELQSQIAGTAPVANSIPANESVSINTFNPELKKSYTLLTDAFEIGLSKNKYDKSLAVDNKYISTVNGSEVSDTSFAYTGFIPVNENTEYTISTLVSEFGTGTYFKNGEKISHFTVNKSTHTFTTPDECTHVTFNIKMAENHSHEDFLLVINTIQLEEGSVSTDYEPFREFYVLKSQGLGRRVVEAIDIIQSNTLTGSETKNKYNKNLAVDNRYISAIDGIERSGTAYALTGYIPVKSNEVYTISIKDYRFGSGTFWNGGERISAFTANSNIYSFITPPECTHVTLNIEMGEGHTTEDFLKAINSIQLEFGNKKTEYEPYKPAKLLTGELFDDKSIPLQKISGVPFTQSKWYGKKWFAIGDSNTEENSHASKKYPKIIAEKTGVFATNYGKSGYGYVRNDYPSLAFHHLIPTLPNDADLITIFGGGNDVRNTQTGVLPIGELGDTTLDTFYGAVDYTLNMLINKYPNAIIAMITQTRRAPTEGDENIIRQMVQAETEVAHKYGLPVLDLFNEGNMYMYNSTFKNNFSTDGVHLNDAGQERIASKIMSFIESL